MTYYVVQKKVTKGWATIYVCYWNLQKWFFMRKYRRRNPYAYLKHFKVYTRR